MIHRRDIGKYGALAGMILGAATIFIVKNYVKIEGGVFLRTAAPAFFGPLEPL